MAWRQAFFFPNLDWEGSTPSSGFCGGVGEVWVVQMWGVLNSETQQLPVSELSRAWQGTRGACTSGEVTRAICRTSAAPLLMAGHAASESLASCRGNQPGLSASRQHTSGMGPGYCRGGNMHLPLRSACWPPGEPSLHNWVIAHRQA
jgi:hypothetical protein